MNTKAAHHFISPIFSALVLGLFLSLALSGCSTLDPNEKDGAAPQSISGGAQPYYPPGIRDVQIPGEVTMNRDETLYSNTDSYTGGILAFEGRVEINSLTDFFITSMTNNGWKMVNNVRFRNVLLAFVKPNKSCIISIYEGKLSSKTRIYIHLTEDIARSNSAPAMSMPIR